VNRATKLSVALFAVLAALTPVTSAQKKSTATSESEKRFYQCRDKLAQAVNLKVLYSFSWDSGIAPRVVVGPTFITMPFDAKEGFADTVNCVAMSGKSGCVNFDLLHWQTNKQVASYNSCKLRMR
jgi:hypothetical protein